MVQHKSYKETVAILNDKCSAFVDFHPFENKGEIDLVIIEVQIGEHAGEDDIVWVEDNHMRS